MWLCCFATLAFGQARTFAGSDVPAERLRPLLAQHVATPILWHDESALLDGSIVCAITGTEIVRLDGATLTRIPYPQVRSVDLQGTDKDGGGVTVKSDAAAITCRFRAGEALESFAQQIRTQTGLH